MPPATKKKRPSDSMDLESDEEPYERKARKQMAQSKLAFGKQVETSAAAPAAAADDSDDDDDEDDLDMSFLGGSSSAKAEEKPAKSRFSDVHSDKPKSKPEPKSMSKTKVRRSLARAQRPVGARQLCSRAHWPSRLPGVFHGSRSCGLARDVLGGVAQQALDEDGRAGGTAKRLEKGDGWRDEAVKIDHFRRREHFRGRRKEQEWQQRRRRKQQWQQASERG